MRLRLPKKFGLAQTNTLLLCLIILLNLYVIASPLYPQLLYQYQEHVTPSVRTSLTRKLNSIAPASPKELVEANQPDQVIIPHIFLDQPIHEGHETYVELAQGVWRWPFGSTPAAGGNTILIGHRFTYTNPRGVFYELNDVRVGDRIGVIWQNKTYNYAVTSVSQVLPQNTTILSQTTQPELTLYTCTPLYVPKYRLVIVARLEHTS